MLTIPVCILALAAGVALLIKVKTSGLGGIYRALSWLVVLLSLLYMLCLVTRSAMHHHRMEKMRAEREQQFKQMEEFRIKHFHYMMGDSTMMKGDSTMRMDSTMKGMHAGMMGCCSPAMSPGCCAPGMSTRGGRGRGWDHHGGGMQHNGMRRGWGKYDGKWSSTHMPSDSTATTKK